MKFAEKIIWSCLLTLAIVFSLGSTIMLYQNHQQLLQTTINHNLSTQDIEVYTLETRLFQDSLTYHSNTEELHKRAIYYINQFLTSSQNKKVGFGLLDANNEMIYASMEKPYLSYMSLQYNQTYSIKHIHNQYLMFITSPISTGKQTIYYTACYDVSLVYQERNRQIQNFIIISCFLFVFAFIILKLLSYYLTKSIYKLNDVSQQIARGEYSKRTKIDSNDEIGELSRHFDEMAAMNEQTIHQLQESVMQKEEFMGSFSHEVKTPMTAIIGFADLLRTFDCDEQTRRKAAQYIYTEGKRLENLSYTLMDLLAISNHTVELEPLSLASIMKQLEVYYQGKEISCTIAFTYDEINVISKADLLFTMLRNLIDNAIKASHKGQTVDVYVKQKDSKAEVVIKDEGIGMDEETLKKATEAFYMADKSRSRKQGGAGLGLSIVKRILDVHQTSLQIESSVEKGTIVSFRLEVADDE